MYFFKRELYKITVIALTNIFLEFVSYVPYGVLYCMYFRRAGEQVSSYRSIVVSRPLPLPSPLASKLYSFTNRIIGLVCANDYCSKRRKSRMMD